MIPAIRWSPGIQWSPAIRWSPGILWSIRSMDFDNRKVYGDTSITDGLVLIPPTLSFSWLQDLNSDCIFDIGMHIVNFIKKKGFGIRGARATRKIMDHLAPGLRSQHSNFASRLFAPQPFSHFSSTRPLALLCSVEKIEQFENLAARRWDNLGFLASATLPSWELHFLRLRPGFEISHFETNKLTGQGFWEEGCDFVQIPGSGDIVQRHHCPLTHASARFLRCWSCNLHKTRPHILCFVVEKLARCKWTGVQSNNLFIFSVRVNASKHSLNRYLQFLAVQDSSIGDLVTHSLIYSSFDFSLCLLPSSTRAKSLPSVSLSSHQRENHKK